MRSSKCPQSGSSRRDPAAREFGCGSVEARSHIVQRLAGASIVGCFGQPATSFGLLAQSLALLVGHVDEHADCARYRSLAVEQRSWIGLERHSAAVRPLGDCDGISNPLPVTDGLSRRAVLVAQGLSSAGVELPADAPAILSELRLASGEIDAGSIPVGDGALAVGGVNGGRQLVEDRAPLRRRGKSRERSVEQPVRILSSQACLWF